MKDLRRRREIHDTGFKLTLVGSMGFLFLIGLGIVVQTAAFIALGAFIVGVILVFHEDLAHLLVNWRTGANARIDELEERQSAMARKLGWRWARIPGFGFWKAKEEDVGEEAAKEARRIVYFPDGEEAVPLKQGGADG